MRKNMVSIKLGAAALTYVVATLISLFELIKYVRIFFQSADED